MSERVSLKQAAAELGMSPQGVREYMKRGLIDIGVVLPNIKGKVRDSILFTGTNWTGFLEKNFKKGVRNGKESKDRRN